jgi:hypothetical protein
MITLAGRNWAAQIAVTKDSVSHIQSKRRANIRSLVRRASSKIMPASDEQELKGKNKMK